MKKNKYHIIRAWMLLLCFVAGQYMVYAHNHSFRAGTNKVGYHHPNTHPQQTFSENCQLCDAMHHNTMAVNSQGHFTPVVVTTHIYKACTYHFISIALILSAGRSPPMA